MSSYVSEQADGAGADGPGDNVDGSAGGGADVDGSAFGVGGSSDGVDGSADGSADGGADGSADGGADGVGGSAYGVDASADVGSLGRNHGFNRSKGLFDKLTPTRNGDIGGEVEICYYVISNGNGVSFTVIDYGEQQPRGDLYTLYMCYRTGYVCLYGSMMALTYHYLLVMLRSHYSQRDCTRSQ